MSKWLCDDEVLVGQGSGEAVQVSPRLRTLPPGSPRSSHGRSPLTSPRNREPVPLSPQEKTMGKAKQLFLLCDKEGKGFITKQDMQRLQWELPLSPEQLETVFDSLDRESNGYLTPVEFNTGLGELVGLEEMDQDEVEEDLDEVECSQDPSAVSFVNILMELGADKLFKDQQELCALWCELQRDRPEMLSFLEGILVHAVSHLQDTIKERDNLEQALRRRESEHDHVVRSIYEEMESQIREEKEKLLAQDSIKQKENGQKLEEELRMRDQELENTLRKQKELEARMRQLSREQANIREQNQQLQSINMQLQEQVDSSREQLQAALSQLNMLQISAEQEQVDKQRNVMKVSRNMKKEKESLLRQLEILRDMNKRLRDEKDAQQSQKRTRNVTQPLQKRGSIIGNYLLQDKPVKRQLSSADELDQDKKAELTNSSKRHQRSCRVSCENVEQTQTQSKTVSPQQVFKVVFLGNSGVGKSAFIQYYCTACVDSKISTTVGIDFKMKTLILDSTTIILQLWDTAGQERFRSITEQYYRKADGILAMYDITHSASFTAVRGWMDSVREKMCEGAVLMLLGNKLDLAGNQCRQVTTEEGQRLAEQHQALFYECSAMTGCNVEELMNHLAGMLVTQHERQREDVLLLTEATPKRSCCT
ncbi:EF-hand calcium-binding domain-containing protein 4A [Archocentrus centrarchus]|uniref:EF-hand calcium-binding domain-containing protein 4A n=1 Tax=Archocentrus centrarchus TaxID=63155 RepID=UPI0011E9C17B|nr:EF-hand calcium-binding domain-containing protein 4A [Archocentrus centrarchus]XP_030587553.1 EF-hand calcium-binding domain-containing protein 4A [Archocentrus centrarchus]XP_030587554.1 EF-hand calcium-binding domain-containing protein 4A [Archocentrus centrarchus]XP_030587555.1 EF-hand calcium-binding domain-containing protein 4A [Archocentrus centrarchus]